MTRPMRFADQPTPGGYLAGEVASALQKSIRRGDERGALWWASELDLAGFGGYAFKRLRIIASEDVGLASTETVIAVHALWLNWLEAKKAKHDDGVLFLLHAVCLLARAPKSGVVVHAWMVFYEGDRAAMRIDVPDEAVDMHTARGRRLGRGRQHFIEEAGLLVNETLPDPYRDEGARAWTKEKQKRRCAPEPSSDQLELG